LRHGNGLASDECNQGRASQDSRGRIWFSNNRGASCYDPAHDRPNDVPPQVHISRVRLYEDDLPMEMFTGGHVFPHRDNYFKFDFIGTNPPAPAAVQYRYRLSRIDRDWVEAAQTFVQYTALPHGSYIFEVKARNGWGYWSEPAALRFSIAAPFWKTWWFIALLALSLGGTITLLVQNRIRHLLALEKLRTKIAADLHDDIGAGLTEISIMSEVVAHKLSDEQRELVADELGAIGAASRRLVRGMSDIVWLVNPRRDSLHDLIARLGDTYHETLRAAGIALKIRNLDSLKRIRLSMERRQHVFLICKEAIHNALKYSGGSVINLAVDSGGGKIAIRLTDDGNGFDPSQVAAGNGLANMKDRAARIGAHLEIDAEPGRGTTVVLTMRS
jgi:signal transduction histidine kinase